MIPGKTLLTLAAAALAGALAFHADPLSAQFAGGPALPIVLPDASDPSPKAVYLRKCGICHAPGGMGQIQLARRSGPAAAMGPPPRQSLLTERDDLSEDIIRTAVRSGIGAMPAIPRGDVSDADLAKIAGFLAPKQDGKP